MSKDLVIGIQPTQCINGAQISAIVTVQAGIQALMPFDDTSIVPIMAPEQLRQCTAVIGIGGVYDPSKHRFDHRANKGAGKLTRWNPSGTGKQDGIAIGQAGLVWHHYGKSLISIMMNQGRSILADKTFDECVSRTFTAIDMTRMLALDARDAAKDAALLEDDVDGSVSRLIALSNSKDSFYDYVRNMMPTVETVLGIKPNFLGHEYIDKIWERPTASIPYQLTNDRIELFCGIARTFEKVRRYISETVCSMAYDARTKPYILDLGEQADWRTYLAEKKDDDVFFVTYPRGGKYFVEPVAVSNINPTYRVPFPQQWIDDPVSGPNFGVKIGIPDVMSVSIDGKKAVTLTSEAAYLLCQTAIARYTNSLMHGTETGAVKVVEGEIVESIKESIEANNSTEVPAAITAQPPPLPVTTTQTQTTDPEEVALGEMPPLVEQTSPTAEMPSKEEILAATASAAESVASER